MSDVALSPAAAKVPVPTGHFLNVMEIVKEALLDHKARLNALDGGGQARSAKPRVRVGAKSYITAEWGGTYETTDGVNYRLVNHERR